MALPYVKKRIKQNLKVSKSQNMRRKKNLFSAFSSHVRVCAFINHLQGISFDDDSDEDADYVPSESEESDELEYDSDVSVSSDEEDKEESEVDAAEN